MLLNCTLTMVKMTSFMLYVFLPQKILFLPQQINTYIFSSGASHTSVGESRLDGHSEWIVNKPGAAEPKGWRENLAQTPRSTAGGGQCDAKSGGNLSTL